MSEEAPKPWRGRLTLIALALLFVAPIIAAWLLTSGTLNWRPDRLTVHGLLVESPKPIGDAAPAIPADLLPAVARPGDWVLALVGTTPCADQCRAAIDLQARILLALGHDLARVRAVVASPEHIGAEIAPVRPDAAPLHIARLSKDVFQRVFGRFFDAPPPTGSSDYQFFIIDYAGHLVVRYPTPGDGDGVLKDLRRLLRASNPG